MTGDLEQGRAEITQLAVEASRVRCPVADRPKSRTATDFQKVLALGGDSMSVGLTSASYALVPVAAALWLGRISDRRNSLRGIVAVGHCSWPAGPSCFQYPVPSPGHPKPVHCSAWVICASLSRDNRPSRDSYPSKYRCRLRVVHCFRRHRTDGGTSPSGPRHDGDLGRSSCWDAARRRQRRDPHCRHISVLAVPCAFGAAVQQAPDDK